MGDPWVMLPRMLAVAGLAAGFVVLLPLILGRNKPTLRGLSWLLGIASAFALGCWLLDVRPHWPPREDQDRFLFVLLPVVLAVEGLAVLRPRWEGLLWALRVGVALATARVLLHDSVYMEDLAGPDSRKWSPIQSRIIFISLGAVLLTIWMPLTTLAEKNPGRGLPLALALCSVASGLVIMLSGYASGGLIGLPLGAALAGAAAGSLLLPGTPDVRGSVGPGVVGMFGLLTCGHFFSELTLLNAALLALAPIACLVVWLPGIRQLRPTLRGVLQVALVGVVVTVALAQARATFLTNSSTDPGAEGPTEADYSGFVP